MPAVENLNFIYPFIILWLGLYFLFYGKKEIGIFCAAISATGFFFINRIEAVALLPLFMLSIATFLTIHYYRNQHTKAARFFLKISFVVLFSVIRWSCYLLRRETVPEQALHKE